MIALKLISLSRAQAMHTESAFRDIVYHTLLPNHPISIHYDPKGVSCKRVFTSPNLKSLLHLVEEVNTMKCTNDLSNLFKIVTKKKR